MHDPLACQPGDRRHREQHEVVQLAEPDGHDQEAKSPDGNGQRHALQHAAGHHAPAYRHIVQGKGERAKSSVKDPEQGRRLGEPAQPRLNATAPVVTRYFASKFDRSRGGSDAGSATKAKRRRVKAAKAASCPIRSASGIAMRHSDPDSLQGNPGVAGLQRRDTPLQCISDVTIGHDVELRPKPLGGTLPHRELAPCTAV